MLPLNLYQDMFLASNFIQVKNITFTVFPRHKTIASVAQLLRRNATLFCSACWRILRYIYRVLVLFFQTTDLLGRHRATALRLTLAILVRKYFHCSHPLSSIPICRRTRELPTHQSRRRIHAQVVVLRWHMLRLVFVETRL